MRKMYKLIVRDVKWEKFDKKTGLSIKTEEEVFLPTNFSVMLEDSKAYFTFARIETEAFAKDKEYPWVKGSARLEEILGTLFENNDIRQMAVNPLVFFVTRRLAERMGPNDPSYGWRPASLSAEIVAPAQEEDDWEDIFPDENDEDDFFWDDEDDSEPIESIN